LLLAIGSQLMIGVQDQRKSLIFPAFSTIFYARAADYRRFPYSHSIINKTFLSFIFNGLFFF